MIPVTAGFDAVTPPVSWEGLKKLNQPALPVLAKFVHRCSKDPATRTAAVTLLVTSLCQLTGRSMTARMPSTIVVNAHDLVPDATDLLASRMVLSVAGLAWHGLDFDAGCPQQKVARVLEYLRSREQ